MHETQSFGQWLHHRRREKDLTQIELGALVGCAQVTIQKIEADELRPSKQLAELLVEKLAIPPEERELYVRFARSGISPVDTQATGAKPPKSNLPAELTSFIGREHEIEEILQLLSKSRLVTLTGAGGVGKSRLALKAAAMALDQYEDGAWFIELASLTDPELIPFTIAATLGLKKTRHESYQSLLGQFLQKRILLLVLDNCEHLIEPCAELAYFLLLQCPAISILVTCRETLDVEGEVVYRIPSLANLDPTRVADPSDLEKTDSVRLFTERVKAILPEFALSRNNVHSIARVCYRLDGIPLAIELAAARITTLSVEQIAERLDDCFRLLIIGNRTALPRHRTLRASIDWSYNTLTEPERLLFQRLSIFSGSWTLEAVEDTCAYDGLRRDDIVDLLTGLVKKSLIQTTSSYGGLNRFRMLETIRQYANEKLMDAGTVEAARDCHLAYFLALAENSEHLLRGRRQVETLDLLESEMDNFRQAIEWALKTDPEAGLRLACALMWLCHIRYYLAEGIGWIERGLAILQETPVSLDPADGYPAHIQRLILRARALWVLGDFQIIIDEFPLARNSLDGSLEIYRQIGVAQHPEIRQGLAWTLATLVDWKLGLGDHNQIEQINQESLDHFHRTGDLFGQAVCIQHKGDLERDPARQKEIYQEELALLERLGDINMLGSAYAHFGTACWINGDYAEAQIAFEASCSYYEQAKDRENTPWMWQYLGLAAQMSGDFQLAETCFDNSVANYPEVKNESRFSFYLFDKRTLAIAQGFFARAIELNEQARQIALENVNRSMLIDVLYFKCRMARIEGYLTSAQSFAEEARHQKGLQGSQKMLVLLELGYLAMECREFKLARALFQEGIHILTDVVQIHIIGFIPYPITALAFLAARERNHELAVRLFATRWCRSFIHFLAPSERIRQENDLASLRDSLGNEQFESILEEGRLMTLEQVLSLTLER